MGLYTEAKCHGELVISIAFAVPLMADGVALRGPALLLFDSWAGPTERTVINAIIQDQKRSKNHHLALRTVRLANFPTTHRTRRPSKDKWGEKRIMTV